MSLSLSLEKATGAPSMVRHINAPIGKSMFPKPAFHRRQAARANRPDPRPPARIRNEAAERPRLGRPTACIAHLARRGVTFGVIARRVAALAKIRIREVDDKSDFAPLSLLPRAFAATVAFLFSKGGVPAPMHAIAEAVADAGAKPILGTPEANDVLVDLFRSRQFDQVDGPLAPISERLDPKRRPLLELLIEILIARRRTRSFWISPNPFGPLSRKTENCSRSGLRSGRQICSPAPLTMQSASES